MRIAEAVNVLPFSIRNKGLIYNQSHFGAHQKSAGLTFRQLTTFIDWAAANTAR